jgi:RNA-directed DNA polymerase
MPKNKRAVEIGVGQLTLTFGLSLKDDAQETQDNGPSASIEPAVVVSKPIRKKKWNSLIDKVYAPGNLAKAWERVRENNGACGSDGMTVETFGSAAEQRLATLAADLRAKTYRPQPVRRKLIPKGGGGMRPLGIPSVRDRIVQQAVLQILEPVFEPIFSTRSHGFRPGRGCATALSVVDRAIAAGYTHVVDADIQSFFDTVDHEKLLDAVNEEVADGSLLKLIRLILTAGVWMPATGEIEPTNLGTPQGGPLSPLLANIYLHRLDRTLMAAKYGLVRYADDFVIFARSEEEARAALCLAEQVLTGELGLTLHPEKTRVVSVDDGFEFLGFHYFRYAKKDVMCKEVRRKSVARFRDAVRMRTPRLRAQRRVKPKRLTLARLRKNDRVMGLIERLNPFLQGWHGYFKHVRLPFRQPFKALDEFVRRRLRSSIVGRTGNGWWTAQLSNAMLGQLGLVSVEKLHDAYLMSSRPAHARKG